MCAFVRFYIVLFVRYTNIVTKSVPTSVFPLLGLIFMS